MFKDLLPIGSVVMLKGGTKKIMIAGMKISKADKPEEFFDYMGVMYPEGYIDGEYNFLFNHSDINDIIFTGYNNPERESFLEFMEETFKNQE